MRNKIDEIFRSRLSNLESGYSGELWDKIEKEIYPQKSNKYPGLWLLFLGVMFLVPVYLLKEMNTPLHEQRNIEQSVNNIDPSFSDTESKNFNGSITKEAAQDDNDQLAFANEIANGNIVKQTIQSNRSNHNGQYNQKDQNLVTEGFTAIEKPLAGNFSNTRGISKPTSNSGVFRIINNPRNQKNKTVLGTSSNVRYFGDANAALPTIERFNMPVASMFHNYNIDPEYCEEKTYNLNKYYSEIFFGLGLAPKSYSSAQAFNGYKTIKSDSETPSPSFNAGFTVGYQFENKFLLEAGFEYAQYNYQVKHLENRMSSLLITIDTLIGPGGAIVIEKDTTVVENFNLVNENLKHDVIDIPILAGFEFDLSNRLSMAIKSGISFNIYSQSSGYLVSPESLAVNISSDGTSSENSYYKSNFGISIPVRAGLYYKMTPEIDLFGRFGVKIYPNSITLDDFEIREKLVYNNLSFGIRVQI